MDCFEFKSNILTFSEGTLSEELRHSSQRHLASCIACSRLVSEFKNLETLIELEKATEPNPFAVTRLLQRIETEFDRSTTSDSPVWMRVLQPVVLAAALLCGILIGSYTAKKDIPANQLVTPSENIEFLRSNLFITEFADEDKILVINK